MLLMGTLIAGVRAGNVGERPLAAAEMAVLHGGGDFSNSCCWDLGFCDALVSETPCAQQAAGCERFETPFGHNLNCYIGGEGATCSETTPYVLCLLIKTCHVDPFSHLCVADDNNGRIVTNAGDCSDDCL